MDFGILYVATGRRCLEEACENARYSRRVMPDIPLSLTTDTLEIPAPPDLFDRINLLENPSYSYRDKILGLQHLPFDTTLFLDSDAKIIHPISSIASLHEIYQCCASLAPVRSPTGWQCKKTPVCFPEFNTGVISFTRTSSILQMLSSWLCLYDELFAKYRQQWDQASFRSVLWSYISKFQVNFYTLPPEYNLRTTKPWIAGRGSPVYVIHGRYDQIENNALTKYLNEDIDKFRTSDLWLDFNPSSTIRPRFDRTYN